jgi:3'-phosphoadenosine 5'-phosphosulfate sulfotransferase (PAPS reductase)/FAD synthetase
MNKVEESKRLIREMMATAKQPAVMLSFGKDSMVLADLINLVGRNVHGFPTAHAFPLPVIYHRDPWFAHKHIFADYVIRSWGMEVHDFPPIVAGVKVNADKLELVVRYNFGDGAIEIPKDVSAPGEHPRRDYICGLNDWITRPKTALAHYPWDAVFMGHKSSDVDSFEGPVPLKDDSALIGGVRLVFPMRHWTDDDLWNYIEANHVPFDETRYRHRAERGDKWYNNDYVHACTACIDPREKAETVFCPKLQRQVKNRGSEVLQLRAEPTYIQRSEAA